MIRYYYQLECHDFNFLILIHREEYMSHVSVVCVQYLCIMSGDYMFLYTYIWRYHVYVRSMFCMFQYPDVGVST